MICTVLVLILGCVVVIQNRVTVMNGIKWAIGKIQRAKKETPP